MFTPKQIENVKGHMDAALDLYPYKTILQSLTKLSNEDRSFLLEIIEDLNYEKYKEKYKIEISPEEFEFMKKFLKLFTKPAAAESYHKLMELFDDKYSALNN